VNSVSLGYIATVTFSLCRG